MAIIPARDARERLYSMYRDKWVDYVEICKRNDYNPSSTYYFWFLDRLKLDVSLQESLFISMLYAPIQFFIPIYVFGADL